MELKGYQQRVINDVDSFLDWLGKSKSSSEAWNAYWAERDFLVGDGDGKCVPAYHDELGGVPRVCLKVPTGGGKTFIGTAAVKTICSRMRQIGPKFVVWLVPSEAILEQTIRNFKNPDHPYRRRLNADFGGRVEIFTKEELLNAQNFSPDTVNTNLCVAIFCYSSIRANPTAKEDRKVYQENGNLQKFESYFNDRGMLMADTSETALVQVMRRLRPIVVVDESHNVKSKLSIEMLTVLGAEFVLSMTATPSDNGRTENVISYVGAGELKAEHMVKLPVMVYNKASMNIVVQNALDLRAALERAAEKERSEHGGRYIRPIVLFQAQPKTGEDSKTYQTIKAKLVEAGIPEEQIKIKTGDNNELEGVDLLSEDCSVRYIITVNALKEGWDCPFAYILASLANRSSAVDVEQIVGRVLRQPYARECHDRLLNMSYVLTSSDNFQETVKNIVRGLNNAGFGEGDCKAEDDHAAAQSAGQQTDASSQQTGPAVAPGPQTESEEDADDISESIGTISVPTVTEATGASVDSSLSALTAPAIAASKAYDNQSDAGMVMPTGIISTGYGIQDVYSDGAKQLRIPQFVVKIDGAFDDMAEYRLLEREDLLSGFSLDGKDDNIVFNQASVDAYAVDVADSGSRIAQANASQTVLEYIAKRMNEVDEAGRIGLLAELAYAQINRIDNLSATEIKDYVKRVLERLSPEQRELASGNAYAFVGEVRKKIRSLEDVYCKESIDKLLADGTVVCRPFYRFPAKITPSVPDGTINKSLYKAEYGDMNPDERQLANDFAACEGVEWWHRIKERGEGEFRLGGKCEGAFNHYPDFIVKMKSGKILLVESKGDDRDNSDSRAKLELGCRWADQAGGMYRYFMVFSNQEMAGAVKRTEFNLRLSSL